jgi:hypothetical protein
LKKQVYNKVERKRNKDMASEMMMKYVSINDNCVLPELGNISGPIINPVWISIDTIWKLLVNRRHVYEHCITDPTKYVVLNRSNYDDYTIYPGNTEIIDPIIDENTFAVTMVDETTHDSTNSMSAGKLYVEIL